MNLYCKTEQYKLYQGNMLDMMENIEPNSIDSIITDPPYELNFMNKKWDKAGISFKTETWKKCYEVLKPGGYLLSFGGTRTYHKITSAIEQAGFEIRDCVMWLYGSGFPKSMSISKGIEAKEKYGKANTVAKRIVEQNCDGEIYKIKQTNNGSMGELIETTRKHYTPTSNLAIKWNGWGTCLKPAYEPIIIARKPFQGSLIDNILSNDVGGLNIEECRIPVKKREYINEKKNKNSKFRIESQSNGRFPANVILTYSYEDFNEVCGKMPYTNSSSGKITHSDFSRYKGSMMSIANLKDKPSRMDNNYIAPGDSGSAARYFYCAKASQKDRNEGLDCLGNDVEKRFTTCCKNTHPTVKPTTLMQYLIRLVTPKNGVILDPFLGSGSTGKAAMYENLERNANYKFIGIEIDEEYLSISNLRIKYVYDMKK